MVPDIIAFAAAVSQVWLWYRVLGADAGAPHLLHLLRVGLRHSILQVSLGSVVSVQS